MTNNTAWAALITRIPAADDLPLTTLLDLIEASATDLSTRTGNEIAYALSPQEWVRCRTASALAQAQPRLVNAAGHNACQAWANNRITAAGQVYQRHAKEVLTEIAHNPFTYLRNHPRHPTSIGGRGEQAGDGQADEGRADGGQAGKPESN